MTTVPSDLQCPEPMTLAALQELTDAIGRHFGWNGKGPEKSFLLFVEEVGELAKSIRKITGLAIEQNNPDKPVLPTATQMQNIGEEMADVLSYLLELANHFNIDLEQAYRAKMAENLQRTWA
jgi:NTP pyrophosphatase (non-canonical NTP hydrolase)